LMASLMAARLCDGPDETARLAGQGLRDVTRIAAGDPALWADIVRANAPAITGVLRGLHADLSRLVRAVEALAGPDVADRASGQRGVMDLLERGTAGLARTWPADAGGDHDGPGPRLSVMLGRRPGELARLLTAVAAFDVTADQVRAEIGAGCEMVVHVAPGTRAADRVAAGLRAGGWRIAGDNRHSDRCPRFH
ncbi:MAG TPA: prephenate dehydrogenase dimerization domain-containing protein, partial [Actinoplanes sp.]|nr:prephenate dehydrogenase dimerization domain-containing protein [Actinoplanes sp.]